MESVTECFVCHENLDSKQSERKLKCNHIFHSICVDEWIQTRGTCPTCRNVENQLVRPTPSDDEGEVYYARIRFFYPQ